jgi:hypothetical protein
MEDGEI